MVIFREVNQIKKFAIFQSETILSAELLSKQGKKEKQSPDLTE